MVKMSIVKLLQKIKFLWIVFGNNDNPYPPNWFKPEKSQFVREILWYIRNPFHNFFWHVIGFKDKPLDYTQIWNTKQKWNLVLPFFSYRGNRIEIRKLGYNIKKSDLDRKIRITTRPMEGEIFVSPPLPLPDNLLRWST